MGSPTKNLRYKYLLAIIPYFFWYQSMKPFFGYSAKMANWNPMLVALLFSLTLVIGFAAWALYFNHNAKKSFKIPILTSAFAAAVFTALLTSFQGVLPIFFMYGAALCSAAIPVLAFIFMYNNLPEKEFGLLTCIALALPTVVLLIALEFVTTGLPVLIPNPGVYPVIKWIAALAVLAGGIMAVTLPAEKAAVKNPAMNIKGLNPAHFFILAVLICLLFSFVTAVQDNLAAESIGNSGQIYAALFFVAVFVAAGMLCGLKGWHIAMYASVALVIASLLGILFNFNTLGVALSNAGSSAFDAAFLFMFMDISVRFKNTAFMLPLGFALSSLVTYAIFLLNILTGKRNDWFMVVIISVFAIVLLPLIALLVKRLSVLNIQGSGERAPTEYGFTETSMDLPEKATNIELGSPSQITEFTERYALTPREAEVLMHTLEGQSAEEIARSLCITQRTTRAHIGNVLKKIGVKNRLQLISTLLSDNKKQ